MNPLFADQASELRSLIGSLRTAVPDPQEAIRTSGQTARTIAVTSGKGGVGKSVLALNLSIALALSGRRVCLLDANLGLGNLDLLCGMNGYWNLSHVLSHARRLRDVILQGPAGISIIPGASGLTELADLARSGRQALLEELALLDSEYDDLIIDCGTGIHPTVRQFVAAAETVLLISTLETTSVADTYAAWKIYHTAACPDVRLILNRAEIRQAQQVISNLRKTARQFLQAEMTVLGCVPDDPCVPLSVASRQPFLTHHPESPASQALQHLANLLAEQRPSAVRRATPPFIQRLQADILSAA